jgi:hypothetical protein
VVRNINLDLRGTPYEYKPSARQCEFHASPHYERLYGGAVGGGKTRALCQEAYELCKDYPGNIGFLCRKDGTDFVRTVLIPVLLGQTIHETLIANHNQKDQRIILKNRSEIWYGGADDINKLQGKTLGFVGIDQIEQINHSVYQEFLARLRLNIPRRCIFGTANPAPGWVKDRFIPPGGTKDTYANGDRIYIPAVIKDNPGLPSDYEQRLRGEHDSIWIRRYVEGDWASFSGAVYSIPSESIRPHSELYRPGTDVFLGVDFGFRRAAVVFVQPRGQDVCILDEIATENETTGLLAKRVAKLAKDKGYRVKVGYCDPAGAARNMQTGISDMVEFRGQSGIMLLSPGHGALRDVVAGVQRVQSRIRDANGKCHLFVARECEWFLTCVENYCYPDHKDNTALKEEPLKDGIHDHMMDAYRYFDIGYFPLLASKVVY